MPVLVVAVAARAFYFLLLCPFFVTPLSPSSDGGTKRRNFISVATRTAAAAAAAAAAFPLLVSAESRSPKIALAADEDVTNISEEENEQTTREIKSQLDSKEVYWSNFDQSENISWSKYRYRSSTLSNSNIETPAIPPAAPPTAYPLWMEGYWKVSYKFRQATFPQGRKILSLRTPGAGIGTCLSLPNVGANPPTFSLRYLKQNGSGITYDDLAYNIPRKFEAFWPQSKVLSVQTNGGITKDIYSSLTPKCFVDGNGCSPAENSKLHLPSSQFAMEFTGPTRSSGRLIQTSELTLVDGIRSSILEGESQYASVKNYSQYNANQDLQAFFKEILTFDQRSEDQIIGRVRVAAFLPYFIKGLDQLDSDKTVHDEEKAVALYDYDLSMKRIDIEEAAQI